MPDREVATTNDAGEFLGVDRIGLGLRSEDRIQVQGVAEQERVTALRTNVGQTVPVEDRLADDDDVFRVEPPQHVKELLAVQALIIAVQELFTEVIHDAGVKCLGMEVDSAIE